MEIYYDILNAIDFEGSSGFATPTRIQQNCNLSYDKFSKYFKELEQKGLIHTSDRKITPQGKNLLEDYKKIKDFLIKMNLEYVKKEEVLKHV